MLHAIQFLASGRPFYLFFLRISPFIIVFMYGFHVIFLLKENRRILHNSWLLRQAVEKCRKFRFKKFEKLERFAKII